MINDISADLVAKLKTVPALQDRVGLSVGGQNIDPLLSNVPMPAAWVLYTESNNIDERIDGSCVATLQHNFTVLVLTQNGNETHLKDNVFTLLEDTIQAVNGQQSVTGTKLWRFDGQNLDDLDSDRIIYAQRYSIVATI